MSTEHITITTDGRITTVAPRDPAYGYSLEELYAHTGAECIEVVYLRDGRIMVVDEEGYLNRKGVNAIATRMAGYPIVGDVLVCDDGAIQ